MAEKGNPRIKNEKQYEALRDQGVSKKKAARIANTPNEEMSSGGEKYEERTKEELYNKAKEVGIEGRSKMKKEELIKALRKGK
ncbi:Rho termination factor N-terminal domain-containing protein [Marivirga sp. S37H4]|uniref:Rho termination factor N-terminal domain-containing protein n=1 Tax=Marivirga aurantiaca TaxID=2802615 RepID=A0A934WX25_9BACT|nr:Rho termination factor N-terminal domain-containing protein [Marivirga aurantiaca]MBK6264689.1 Rho termination factor N-terminal domain-containing protein [Marivirga aurantiaca]